MSLPVGCDGVNHADFSPDGRYFIVTCEYSGDLLKIDTVRQRVIARKHLPGDHPMPQDIKISPNGRTWYVADMQTGGVWVLDGGTFGTPSFVPTGDGAHGLYPSRDSRYLYVANRGEGTISLLGFATGKVARKWKLPGHASPDMGGVSADGNVLWLSGRYDHEVYAIDTTTGHLLARNQGWYRTARPLRLAAARPLLPGPHWHPALTDLPGTRCTFRDGQPASRRPDDRRPYRRTVTYRRLAKMSVESGWVGLRPASTYHSRPATAENSGAGSRLRTARVRRPRPPSVWLVCARIAARFCLRYGRTSTT